MGQDEGSSTTDIKSFESDEHAVQYIWERIEILTKEAKAAVSDCELGLRALNVGGNKNAPLKANSKKEGFHHKKAPSQVVVALDMNHYPEDYKNISEYAQHLKDLMLASIEEKKAKFQFNKTEKIKVKKDGKIYFMLSFQFISDKAKAKDLEKHLTKKEDNPSEWYQQTIVRSGMIEYFDVKGCYILRPWSYQIWEAIREYIDTFIKNDGVQNCYFPLFVTKRRLEAEEQHIEGFAPEVAWVTKSGDKDLAEPIGLRPTSETIMYPAYAKWIRSHRDLPLRLNQWANVVRWELSNPQPFIRSREFLWQEGHSAYATLPEAEKEVMKILGLYERVYTDLLAIPVIRGKKTEKEKFAGGFYTTTVEAYVDINGRAVQGATSHCLGQNFSKMFNIEFLKEDKTKAHCWQNSWGMTTRTIGVMVMIHGDNKGLVLPPGVAPTQIVIIPLIFSKSKFTPEQLNARAHELAAELKKAGLRVEVDDREDKNPGWKYAEAENRGIPLRIELGPRDMEKNQCVFKRRFDDAKSVHSLDSLVDEVNEELKTIHDLMYNRAKKVRDERLKVIEQWEDFVPLLDKKCIVLAPFCEEKECETNIKNKSKEEAKVSEEGLSGAAKSLCIPFDQSIAGKSIEGKKCFCCGSVAKSWTLFGRSY